MTTSEPILVLRDVARHFGGVRAVDGVSLDVGPRQIRAIIGPNGAGKTTLFNLITGHLPLTAGEVWYRSRRISGFPPHRITPMGLARTFQNQQLFPELTALENLRMALFCHHRRALSPWPWLRRDAEIDRRADAILTEIGLGGKAGRLVRSLSHGEQKALDIGLALALEPQLLLLDEPTAGMSPEETRAMIRLVQHLNDTRGLTILLIEHDMEVVGIAEDVFVLESGRPLTSGPPDQVLQDEKVIQAYLGKKAAAARAAARKILGG